MRFSLLAAVAALGVAAGPAPAQFTIRPLTVAPLYTPPLSGGGPSYGPPAAPGGPARSSGFTIVQRPYPGAHGYDPYCGGGGAWGSYYRHYYRPQGWR